jgi:hypothetical protein
MLSSRTGPFVPYRVSVMPRNVAGCGEITTIDCFAQEGGGKLIIKSHRGKIISIHAVKTATNTGQCRLRDFFFFGGGGGGGGGELASFEFLDVNADMSI